jgi:hypothetical protein
MKAKTNMPTTPAGRAAAGVAIAVGLTLVGIAQRDIQRRPDDEVRGSKWLWRIACLNAVGALAYFRWGRRAAA